jgi:hypothetical protein
MYETRVEYGTTFDRDWSADVIYKGKQVFTCTGQDENDLMLVVEDWLDYHTEQLEGIVHVVIYVPTSAQ